MEFTACEIKKVAKLAKIKLTTEEIELFGKQFSDIVKVINDLQKVDTSNISPIVNPSKTTMNYREDIVTEKDKSADILREAPQSSHNCFQLPKLIE